MGDSLFESIVDPVLGVTRPSDFHGETVGYHHTSNKLRSVKPAFEPYVTAKQPVDERQTMPKISQPVMTGIIYMFLAIVLVLILVMFLISFKLSDRIAGLELRALVEDIKAA